MSEPTWSEQPEVEDEMRDEEAEARAAQTVELVEQTSREAQSVLTSFWSSVREVRSKLSTQGVVMPEQLDRQR